MAEESLHSTGSPQRPSPQSERGSSDGSQHTGTSPEDCPNTPSRKNKRKSSEPRKRSDFNIKRFCPDEDLERGTEVVEESEAPREFPPDTPETVASGSTPDPEESRSNRGFTPLPPEIGWYSIPIQGTRVAMPAVKKAVRKLEPKSHKANDDTTHIPALGTCLSQSLLVPPAASVLMMPPGTPAAACSPSSSSSTPAFLADNEYDDDSPTYLDPVTGRPTRRPRKNYKNMTRERRVEANARERSRVHTISAAFESLRRAVPSYSYNQKLSKLAILRIACSYIMALSKLADVDLCKKTNSLSFIDCVDLCTQTIQTEGRARRRH